MFSGERDPDEIQYHDNQYIIDDQDEDAGDAATGADAGLPED